MLGNDRVGYDGAKGAHACSEFSGEAKLIAGNANLCDQSIHDQEVVGLPPFAQGSDLSERIHVLRSECASTSLAFEKESGYNRKSPQSYKKSAHITSKVCEM